MSFNDFQNIQQVIKKYPLTVIRQEFLPEVAKELPELLLENLRFYLKMQGVGENEFFFTESFVYPLITEAWKHHTKLKVWSHQTIALNNDLCGAPDYLVSSAALCATESNVRN